MRRVVGVDTARGVAVLGMVTAHVGPADDDRRWPPGGFAQLADGRPSALFVVLAGVALALLSGGTEPLVGSERDRARVRILVRAALLVVLGAVLIRLGTPIVVILVVHGVLLAAGTAVLGWPRWALLVAAGTVAVVGPVLRHLWAEVPVDDARPMLPMWVLLNDYYPALVWFAYTLTGLAVGRCDLRSPRVHATLTGSGVALVLLGHGGAWWAGRATRAWWATAEPHSSTTFELAGNTGVALLVLSFALAAGCRWPRALAPVTATGALALTAYTAHLVVLARLGPGVVYQPTTATWLGFILVLLGGCWAWRATWGRGPLERLLHAASTLAVRGREGARAP